MNKKANITFASTKASNLYVGTGDQVVFSSGSGALKVEPPPPLRWAASFKVRSMMVTLNSSQKNRDRAILEMSQLLYSTLREPCGITLDSMYRL